jgi:hypothetical protein
MPIQWTPRARRQFLAIIDAMLGLQALAPENLLWITMSQEASKDVANRCSDAQQ